MTAKTTKKTVKKKPVQKKTPEQPTSSSTGFWWILISLLIIVGIFAALLWQRTAPPTTYNEFVFTEREDGLWNVRIEVNGQPYTIVFHHHPSELEDIQVQKNIQNPVINLANKVARGEGGQLIITMDPHAPADLAMAYVELSKVLGKENNLYNIPTRSAYSKPSDSGDNIPVFTCWEADADHIVLWLKTEGEDIIVAPTEHCIVLQGTNASDTIRVADRYIYGVLGIMDNP